MKLKQDIILLSPCCMQNQTYTSHSTTLKTQESTQSIMTVNGSKCYLGPLAYTCRGALGICRGEKETQKCTSLADLPSRPDGNLDAMQTQVTLSPIPALTMANHPLSPSLHLMP
jgi:hypothetical protein